MSLLIGAHLSDRIYMCADTRVSRRVGSDLIPVHDNILKIAYIGSSISVGCVGSPRLGAFIIEQIKKQCGTMKIGELEDWLRKNIGELTHQYLIARRRDGTTPTKSEANSALVFVGIDDSRKKKISGKQLHRITKIYQDAQQDRTDKLFGGKKMEDMTDVDWRRFTHEAMQSRMGLKDVILQSILKVENATEIELPMFDQKMFLCEIVAEQGKVEVKAVPYGEIIVRGGGYVESDLPVTFLGDLDLNMKSGNINTDIVPFIAEIHDKYSASIGGSITNLVILGNEMLSLYNRWIRMPAPGGPEELLYHTRLVDGNSEHLVGNNWHRLTPFTEELDVLEGELVL